MSTLPRHLLAFSLALVGSVPALGQGDPFNPSGYLQNKADEAANRAQKLDSKGIFKIDGQRFQQFVSSEGAVYLPGTGSMPDLHEEFAVCQSHLRFKSEVLEMRKGLPIDAEIKKIEPQLIALIRKCQEGKIKGPTVYVETRDGAVVELKAEDKSKHRSNSLKSEVDK